MQGGGRSRPVMAPFAEQLAARLAGASYQAMTGEAAAWTAALTKTADLLALDGVIVGADPTLLAESLGAQVDWRGDTPALARRPEAVAPGPAAGARLAVALETADRLFQTIRGARVGIAAMTGPLTLAEQLFGAPGAKDALRSLKPSLVSIAEAYCKTRPDILLLMETAGFAGKAVTSRERRAFSALRNVASYYNVRLGLYVEEYAGAALDGLAALNMDFYVAGVDAGGKAAPVAAILALAGQWLGLALPFGAPDEALEMLDKLFANAPGGQECFVTSLGEIPPTTDVAVLRDLLGRLRTVSS